ncbi:hypothetical protein RN001_003024 [Aquatica leii]|uniref:Uncharacterized protein n=1 Tax=Aquatica leii TaxID=1421715 RepID=A0AAN7SRG2_9COLE|nr:hypothetical protein RN001_003024 [Aquatica leii]
MDSSSKKVGVRGKIIHSQGREIIANVLKFFKQEAENGVTIPLTNFKQRLLAATKISEISYRRISKESDSIERGETSSFSSPRKERPKRCTKKDVLPAEKQIIRNIIHNFYLTERRRPTLRGTKSGDYHDEMNASNFFKWVENQLIPNLPPRSVLVVDKASYHNVKYDKNPTSATLKQEMVDWLTEKNIPHNESSTKTELYEIIKIHKEKAL